jgi:hypothetical protein
MAAMIRREKKSFMRAVGQHKPDVNNNGHRQTIQFGQVAEHKFLSKLSQVVQQQGYEQIRSKTTTVDIQS